MHLRSLFFGILLLWFSHSMVFGQNSAMTFNIRYANPDDGKNAWGKRKAEVLDLIYKYHPDIIGIQEALPKQLRYLKRNLKDFAYIGHGRDGKNSGSEATPIFYHSEKFELLDHRILWLSETPDKISKGWDAALNRIMVYGKFKDRTSGEILHVINTHFDHQGATARLKSAEMILDFLSREQLTDQRILLMGDLNATPSEDPVQLLCKELQDAWDIALTRSFGPEGTFNGFDMEKEDLERIDYIFTRNLKIKSYQCIDRKRKNGLYPSDHFPIQVSF